MQIKALLRYAKISPRKMRAIANAVRGLEVGEALSRLRFIPRKGSRLLMKLLLSAVKNAEQKGVRDLDSLVVDGCYVDNGPIVKRWLARAMGRADRIQHRTSHIGVVLTEGRE